MSALNDSVIICDAVSNSAEKKTSLRSKNRVKIVKKTFYENSLRHIQLSAKRWRQIEAQKKLLQNVKQVDNNKNTFFSSEADSVEQDSVIILSDNEFESTSKENEDICKDSECTKKRSFESSEDDSNKPLGQRETRAKKHQRKKRKVDSVSSINNNTSCLLISDTEDSDIVTIAANNENIAPLDSINQSSDDIVVVWSSSNTALPDATIEEDRTLNDEKEKESTTNCEKEEETVEQQEISNRLFMIDCSPNEKNLKYLRHTKNFDKCFTPNAVKKNQNNEPDLIFSIPGLVFPMATDISHTIMMKKPKSLFNALAKLELKASESYTEQTPLPSTSKESTSKESTSKESTSKESTSKESTSKESTAKESTSKENNTLLTTSHTTIPSTPAKLTRLRPIIIDGNNVAMAYTNGKAFSEKGILMVIDYFKKRGHSVKVFIPQYRRAVIHQMLEKWYTEGIAVFTPSRYIAGRWITSYDDRYILQYATMCEGIVISMDQYRDLYKEKPEWRETILNRLLVPTFVGDIVMFPDDPLGRSGPRLDEFLRY
ncbi:PREDICTED: probable ribonuclease ZC3H12C [Dufourea novaeangliae]|uniref:Putative ribonuclease ZC3H12C n=1 Tax=Dufourea novaeangliae TaxID=178035 RepID=A0A154PQ68_DUFNO|nr:PREDICTED: probable ribonuclease ZC3H12C [Dufourea novaeangliae]KZC13270.1 putative ribonuclease ZC3H12C [Dufourea novaeangliae]